jgi:Cdc6-like AAA superfamily ATPase
MVNGSEIPTFNGLPLEIHKFFLNPGGHSLIIKGRAGTGKTTLVLQMLEEVFTGLDNFYLSSRVSDTSLYKQFPWLLNKERNERLIHASKRFLDSIHTTKEDGEPEVDLEVPVDDALLMTAPAVPDEVKSAKALLKEFRLLNGSFPVSVDRTELSRVEGMFEPPEIETMDDEGGGFTQFHNLVVDFDSDLPEIERIYERVESQLPKQICVAIDSIEALSEKYGIPEGRIINMLQKDLVENSNTHLVIVIEKFDNLDLDYYVDGVILLDHGELDGRGSAVHRLTAAGLLTGRRPYGGRCEPTGGGQGRSHRSCASVLPWTDPLSDPERASRHLVAIP